MSEWMNEYGHLSSVQLRGVLRCWRRCQATSSTIRQTQPVDIQTGSLKLLTLTACQPSYVTFDLTRLITSRSLLATKLVMDRCHRPWYFTLLTVTFNIPVITSVDVLIFCLAWSVGCSLSTRLRYFNSYGWIFTIECACLCVVDGTGGGMIQTPDDHFQRPDRAWNSG